MVLGKKIHNNLKLNLNQKNAKILSTLIALQIQQAVMQYLRKLQFDQPVLLLQNFNI